MTVTIELDTIKDNIFKHTKVKHTNQLLATYVIAKYGIFKNLNNNVVYTVYALDTETNLIEVYDLRDILNDLLDPVIVSDNVVKDVRTYLKPLGTRIYTPIKQYNNYVKAINQKDGCIIAEPLNETELNDALKRGRLYNAINDFLKEVDLEVTKLNNNYDFK